MAQRLRATCMRYNWDEIAESTMQVMERVAGRSAPLPLQETEPEPDARRRPRSGAPYLRLSRGIASSIRSTTASQLQYSFAAA